MRNRLEDYDIKWWNVLNVQLPFDKDEIDGEYESPSDEAISRAYRAIAEYPDVHSKVSDVFDALQKLRSMPFSKEKELLLERYGPLIEKIHMHSQLLNDTMKRDFAQAEQYRDEEDEE
jgi:hypothetical protein